MAQRQASKFISSGDELSVLCVETTAGHFGGYKTQLLITELLPVIREFFFCYKCNNILRDPVSLEKKLVCLSCSPRVGAGIGKKRVIIQHDVMKRVSKLQVHCPHKERGCEWEGELGEITVHIGKCSHMSVTCELGCQQKLFRREIDKHSVECKHRIESCKFCEKKYKALEENTHFSNCPRYPVKCTQGCGDEVAREELSVHLTNECSETRVKCPYRKQGCDVEQLKRCELNAHVREGRDQHEILMRRKVEFLEKELKKLREVVEKNSSEIEIHISGSSSNKAEFDEKIEALSKVDTTTRKEIGSMDKRLNLVEANKRRLNENESTIVRLRSRQENSERCIDWIHYDIDEFENAMYQFRLKTQALKDQIQKQEYDEIEFRTTKALLYFLCCVVAVLTAIVVKWSLE